MMKSSKMKRRIRRKHQSKIVEQTERNKEHNLEELQPEIVSECDGSVPLETATTNSIDMIECRSWSDLPIDIVELIALRLFRSDFAHLTCVCRRWQSIGPLSLFTKHHPFVLTDPDMPLLKNHLPWLMFSQKDDDFYTFWDPLHKSSYIVNIPELSGSRLLFSKDGWVFILRVDRSLALFNPFIRKEIEIPDLIYNDFHSISISTPPTSSNSLICVFLCYLQGMNVYVYGHGNMDWTHYVYENNLPFIISYSNPIFLNGVFYVLGHDGKIGIFNPHLLSWEVQAKPRPLKFCKCYLKGYQECQWENYLVELRGVLLMVFVGFLGTQVHVYRLDRSKMEWIKIESLGDFVLFVGRWTSIISATTVKRMTNKIYFPGRSGSTDGVFYSLEDQRCYPTHNFYGSEEYINCTWVDPRWYQPSAAELAWC